MSVTIMLDAGALSKLIEISGEDFRLKLTHAVLSIATTRHVKTAADKAIKEVADVAAQALLPAIRLETEHAVAQRFGVTVGGGRWGSTFKPSDEMIKTLKAVVDTEVANAAREDISKARDYANKLVEAKLADIERTVENRVNAAWEKSVAEEVDRRIKARLAAIAAAAAT